MNNLRLDDCCHCACVTHLLGYTRERATQELKEGLLGCDNCIDDQEEHPDGHITCVVLYDGDEAVWDGRCTK